MQVRHELRPLTSARGIAAWYIVLYHIRGSAGPALPSEIMAFLSRGYLAVDFFFVLSGFVIWLNYRTLLGDHRWGAVPHFLWRRIARIYPLHLLILLGEIAFALVCIATARPIPPDQSWDTLPYHLLLIQNWGFLPHLGWNDPAWSISCELAAYLAFPLLVIHVDWRRLPIAALMTALAILMLGLFAVFAWSGRGALGNDIPQFGLPRCLFEFAMGTIAAALWLRWRDTPRRPAMGVALVGLAGFGGYLAGAPEPLVLPLVFVCLVLLIALTANAPANPMRGRVIHWFGEISYATYLAHAFLFMLFKILFVDEASNVAMPLLGLFLLVVIAVSAALYHGFELPAQKWMNRRGPKRPN